ncbi:MAG: hypothetical protein O6949_04600 [Chloroflexi bacterium]|nr:hypothetical protein [Chloroflexota bacterium]
MGVKLGGGVEIDGVTEGVESAAGDDVTVGVKGGELVGLTLPDGVTEVGAGAVAEAVGLVAPEEVGGGLPSAVEVSAGVGANLSAGEVSGGCGAGYEGVATLGGNADAFSGPLAVEAGGREKKNKSPASDRAPAGLNRRTFTLSS